MNKGSVVRGQWLSVLSVLFVLSVPFFGHAAIPEKAEDWYQPKDGFDPTEGKGTVSWFDEGGNVQSADITVSSDGEVTGLPPIDLSGDAALKTAWNAVEVAAAAIANNKMLQNEIEELGKNLDAAFNEFHAAELKEKTEGGVKSIWLSSKDKNGNDRQQGNPVTVPADAMPPPNADMKLYVGWNSGALGPQWWELPVSADPNDPYALYSENGTIKHYGLSTYTPLAGNEGPYVAVQAPAGSKAFWKWQKLGSLAVSDDVTTTTNADYGAVSPGALSLYGWTDPAAAGAVLSELLAGKDAEGRDEYLFLARHETGEDGAELVYVPLGDVLGDTAWVTNWTEAVEHITREETIKIVNWTTNWVEHSYFVTNYEDIVNVVTNAAYHENFITNIFSHEDFVTNLVYHESFLTNVINHEAFVTNVIEKYSAITNFEHFATFQTNVFYHEEFVTNVIENMQAIENWNVVTNFIVRYLGGSYEQGETPETPTLEPEDDPYSEDYEETPLDDYLLPDKNALMLVAITNEPLSRIESANLLDNASVWTNGERLVEVKGFEEADDDTMPVKRDGADGPSLEWVQFPSALLAVTTNELAEIREWMVVNNVSNILSVVVTNFDALAKMSTNFFGHVGAATILDNASVWTNGESKVEARGFAEASGYTVPMKWPAARAFFSWRKFPFGDAEAYNQYAVTNASRTIDVGSGFPVGSDESVKTLSLYGFEDASNGQFPRKGDDNELEWCRITNPGGSVDIYDQGGTLDISLDNWNEPGDTCKTTLSDMLMGGNEAKREVHEVMTRYKVPDEETGNYRIHYTPIGDILPVYYAFGDFEILPNISRTNTHGEAITTYDLKIKDTFNTSDENNVSVLKKVTGGEFEFADIPKKFLDGHADTADHAHDCDYSEEAGFATNCTDAAWAERSGHSQTSDWAEWAGDATNALHATHALWAGDATNALHATEADHADSADSAGYASQAGALKFGGDIDISFSIVGGEVYLMTNSVLMGKIQLN